MLVRCPRNVHAVDVDGFGMGVEKVQCVFATVAGEVAVVSVDQEPSTFCMASGSWIDDGERRNPRG